jgi:hypothetical protein
MRLIHVMSFVCAMLLLAMIPACIQFGRLSGVQPAASLATVGALAALAFLTARRLS